MVISLGEGTTAKVYLKNNKTAKVYQDSEVKKEVLK